MILFVYYIILNINPSFYNALITKFKYNYFRTKSIQQKYIQRVNNNKDIGDSYDIESHDIVVQKLLKDLKYQLVIDNNTTGTLVQLIKYGDEWEFNRINHDNTNQLKIFNHNSEYEKVIGCMASVYIKTKINRYSNTNTTNNSNSSINHNESINYDIDYLEIDGYADSRVAQGMLALLSNVSNTS